VQKPKPSKFIYVRKKTEQGGDGGGGGRISQNVFELIASQINLYPERQVD
jgi:hypothetical protein